MLIFINFRLSFFVNSKLGLLFSTFEITPPIVRDITCKPAFSCSSRMRCSSSSLYMKYYRCYSRAVMKSSSESSFSDIYSSCSPNFVSSILSICSWYFFSWITKAWFGLIRFLLFLTYSRAALKEIFHFYIMKAMTQEAERDFPAKQWTRTLPSLSSASYINLFVALKYLIMFTLTLSNILTTLYLKS